MCVHKTALLLLLPNDCHSALYSYGTVHLSLSQSNRLIHSHCCGLVTHQSLFIKKISVGFFHVFPIHTFQYTLIQKFSNNTNTSKQSHGSNFYTLTPNGVLHNECQALTPRSSTSQVSGQDVSFDQTSFFLRCFFAVCYFCFIFSLLLLFIHLFIRTFQRTLKAFSAFFHSITSSRAACGHSLPFQAQM